VTENALNRTQLIINLGNDDVIQPPYLITLLKRCPLNAGTPTPSPLDLQLSFGKKCLHLPVHAETSMD